MQFHFAGKNVRKGEGREGGMDAWREREGRGRGEGVFIQDGNPNPTFKGNADEVVIPQVGRRGQIRKAQNHSSAAP